MGGVCGLSLGMVERMEVWWGGVWVIGDVVVPAAGVDA